MSPVECGNPVVRERTKPVRMLSARPPVAAQTTGDEPRATSQPASPIEADDRADVHPAEVRGLGKLADDIEQVNQADAQ